MQLVGAPFSYIRGPAIVEGLLLGGIGAAVALVAIAILYSTLSGWLGTDLAGLVGIGQMRFLGPHRIRDDAIRRGRGRRGRGHGGVASRPMTIR